MTQAVEAIKHRQTSIPGWEVNFNLIFKFGKVTQIHITLGQIFQDLRQRKQMGLFEDPDSERKAIEGLEYFTLGLLLQNLIREYFASAKAMSEIGYIRALEKVIKAKLAEPDCNIEKAEFDFLLGRKEIRKFIINLDETR